MDGVVVDSEPTYMDWLRCFLKEEKVFVSEAELCSMVGISAQNYKRYLQKWWIRAGKEPISGERLYRIFDMFCEKYAVTFKKLQNPYVEEVMCSLKKGGYQIALASSSPMKDILKVLRETNLMRFVDEIISGNDCRESKPHPEIYCRVMEKLKLKNTECIAVEDSPYGIQAARNAGIVVAAKREERFGFSQDEAEYLLDNLHQIIPLIEKINELNKSYS